MILTLPKLPRFSLRSLLLGVALCALAPAAYHYRPGQLDPEKIELGMSKWYLRWACGASLPTNDVGVGPVVWIYSAPARSELTLVYLEFGEDGRVSKKEVVTG